MTAIIHDTRPEKTARPNISTPQSVKTTAMPSKGSLLIPYSYTLMPLAQEVGFLRHSPRPGLPRPPDRNDSADLARIPQRSRSTEQVAKPYRRWGAPAPPRNRVTRGPQHTKPSPAPKA